MVGGVAIHVRDGISAVFRQDIHIYKQFELKSLCTPKAFLLAVFIDHLTFIMNTVNSQLLEEIVDRTCFVHTCNIIVAGDFNINTQISSLNKMTRSRIILRDVFGYMIKRITTPFEINYHHQICIDNVDGSADIYPSSTRRNYF
jgi:hypothetical protein